MTEQTLQGHYAGFVTRLTAWLIDRGIIGGVLAFTAWLVSYLMGILGINITQCNMTGGWQDYVCWFVTLSLLTYSLVFGPLYMMIFWTLAGATPGKVAVGVRVVRMDGKPMSFRTSFRRYIGYMMSFVALGAGFLLILVDNKRQGWDDKLAGTCVVYTWKARQNETLIQRMTKKLFSGQERIDHYSEELSGKSIYGTDKPNETASEADTNANAGGDAAVTKHEGDSKQDAGASSADQKTSTPA